MQEEELGEKVTGFRQEYLLSNFSVSKILALSWIFLLLVNF